MTIPLIAAGSDVGVGEVLEERDQENSGIIAVAVSQPYCLRGESPHFSVIGPVGKVTAYPVKGRHKIGPELLVFSQNRRIMGPDEALKVVPLTRKTNRDKILAIV